MEELEQSPDPGAAAEFALRQLQGRFTEHPAEELRVEVEGEVDGEPDPVRVPPAVDVLVATHWPRLPNVGSDSDPRAALRRGRDRAAHERAQPTNTPPDGCRSSPVKYDASSEARNSAVAAISSGVP